MGLIFFVAGLLACFYFIIIVIYTKNCAYWSFIWIFLAAIFFVLSYFSKKIFDKDLFPIFAPIFIKTSLALFLVSYILLFLIITIFPLDEGEYAQTDFLIVVGDGSKGQTPSENLRYTLDEAVDFSDAHPETTLILDGGTRDQADLMETMTMFSYLSHNGVPSQKMLLNSGQSDAFDNMENVVALIEIETERRKRSKYESSISQSRADTNIWEENYIPTVAILTADYQMLRCVRILEHFGIENPDMISADSDAVLYLHHVTLEMGTLLWSFSWGV